MSSSTVAFYAFFKFLSNAKNCICDCMYFCLSTLYWPNFAVAFILSHSTPCSDGAWFQPGIWWKKGSFLLFCISCFCRLPGEGVGWLHHSPLSRTGLTTLMWPCSAPLLCPAMGVFLHCVVWHLMSPSIRSPFKGTFTKHSDFKCSTPT